MKASNGSTNCYGHENASTNWNGSTNRFGYGNGGDKESVELDDDQWNIDDQIEFEETESEGEESEFDPYREVMEKELDPYREVL